MKYTWMRAVGMDATLMIRVVRVVHVQVHAAQSDDLVELVTTFVDFAKTWHEHANLFALLVGPLGKHP